MPRPRTPGSGGSAALPGKPTPGLQIRWAGFRPMYDYWGEEIRRYYQLDTLAAGVEQLVFSGQDRIVLPSVHRILGPAPISSLVFELFQEGKYQLIFRMRAANAKRREASFAFVAAKQDGSFSRVAETEHQNLRWLHERAPNYVVRPFAGGPLRLPELRRRGGENRDRKIYAYLTQWLGDYHELGIDRGLQLFMNVRNPQLFSLEHTDQIKSLMLEIVARTYDPVQRRCMEMPQVASGDFVVTNPRRTGLKLKLIACRRLMERISPSRMLHMYAVSEWDWGGRAFRLTPSDPAWVLKGLSAAVGREKAREWLGQYARGVLEERYPEQPGLSLEVLEAIGAAV